MGKPEKLLYPKQSVVGQLRQGCTEGKSFIETKPISRVHLPQQVDRSVQEGSQVKIHQTPGQESGVRRVIGQWAA